MMRIENAMMITLKSSVLDFGRLVLRCVVGTSIGVNISRYDMANMNL